MRCLLLGSMLVADDTHSLRLGGFRQRMVLAVLLLSPDRAVDVDMLLEVCTRLEPGDVRREREANL